MWSFIVTPRATSWDSRKVSAGANVRLYIRCLLPTLGAAKTCSAPSENSWDPPRPGQSRRQFDDWVESTMSYKLITMHGCSAETDWCKTPIIQTFGALSSAKGPVASGTVIWLLQRQSKCNKNEARWHGNTTRPIKSKNQCPPIHWPSYEVPGANTKYRWDSMHSWRPKASVKLELIWHTMFTRLRILDVTLLVEPRYPQ